MSQQSQSTKDYLISIAEHLLEQNCEKQLFQKYQRIKSTLMKKQQQKIKLMTENMSAERIKKTNTLKEPRSNVKLKSSSKECFSTTKRRESLSPVTNNKFNIIANSTKKISKDKATFFTDDLKTTEPRNTKSNIKKNSNQKILQNECITGRRSEVLKRKKLFNETQTILQRKLNEFPSHNKKLRSLLELSATQYAIDNKLQSSTKDKQDLSAKGLINLNINLNKILKAIETASNQQSHQKDMTNSRQCILSEENILLIKKINKQLIHCNSRGELSTQVRRPSNFKKEKAKREQVEIKCIAKTEGKEKQRQNENAFSFLQVITPQKENLWKTHQFHKDLPSTQKANQQNTEPNFAVSIQRQLQTIKKSYKQKQSRMEQKINELKKDNNWLVQNMEKLLNQNQQLKAIFKSSW